MEEGKQYLIESVTVGDSVKVTALDPVTLREASIIGPLSATHEQLAQLAVRKLEYVLHKNRDT